MQKVAVIGAGTMGNGIAHLFAQHGHHVHLVDVSAAALARARQTITQNLDRQVKKALIDEAGKQRALDHIHPQTDLAAGVADRDLVVEVATERLTLKLEILP